MTITMSKLQSKSSMVKTAAKTGGGGGGGNGGGGVPPVFEGPLQKPDNYPA